MFGRLGLWDQYGDSGVADGDHQGNTGMGLVKVDQSGWQEMARYRLAGLDLETSTS